MTGRSIATIALSLTLTSLATAALAEDQVRDTNGVLVGNIQGWNARSPLLVLTDGPRKVRLGVEKRHFETVDFAKFTTADCTGTVYADAAVLNLGINDMQGVVYVMRSKNKLFRTKTNTVQSLPQQSYWAFGECKPIGGTVDLIEAPVFVRNLYSTFAPPYKVE